MSSVGLFNALHDIIQPHVLKRFKGSRSPSKRVYKSTPKKLGRSRKLHSKDEFLLMLMKIRLGLLSTDIADRFSISVSTCSEIFQCWIRATSECLSCIVHIPSEESIRSTLPVRFKNYCDLMGIIDCSEIFIETPKDLNFQSVTWSDYKHHNTIKYLISVAPNSFITYISKPYTGRISDKALTIDSGYLDLLPAYSRVMADKGFNIADECAARHLYFTVPPGKRGCSQMTPSEVKKTSDIAKLRILL